MVIKDLENIQIRIPKNILAEVDELVKRKIFSSRSEIIRESLRRYILENRIYGSLPYIIGPFSQKELDNLKEFLNNPQNLSVSQEKLKAVQKLLGNQGTST